MGKIRVNEYILNNPNIKENTTILNITDTHGNVKALTDILELLKQIKTNYICLPGDILDHIEQENQEEFTNALKKLNDYAKTYISLGNHDLTHKNKTKEETSNIVNTSFYEYMKDFKGKLFIEEVNEFKINKYMTIYAVNLPREYYSSKDNINEFNKFIERIEINPDENKFNILLIHSPNGITRKKEIIDSKLTKNMNLILCGHNHGGLTPIWVQDLFKNHLGFVGPYDSFFQNNAYGIWTKDNTNVLVSNGVVKVSDTSPYKDLHDFIRLFFLPEVDLIHLNNSDKNEFYLDKRKVYKL